MSTTLDRRPAADTPHRTGAERPPHRTLRLEVVAGGDPVRFSRIVSAVVNNTSMALAEVHVGEQVAYPVPSLVDGRNGPVVLTLRLRDRGQILDRLLVEEIISIVSTTCRVVDARRVR